MKVGDYVRTEEGYIYKIEDGEEFFEDSVDVGIGIIPDVDGIWIDKEHFQYVDKRKIIKSSPNIIDLIEVGDYVNSHKVIYTIGDIHKKVYVEYGNMSELLEIKPEQIKSIVTKEQFESMKYRIGE